MLRNVFTPTNNAVLNEDVGKFIISLQGLIMNLH